MRPPAATVVLITYDQEQFVEEALRSILAQDCADFELVVADDCSRDGTLGVIRRVLATTTAPFPVRFLGSERNVGVVGNWNRAVEAARGDVIIGAAGDDIMTPDRVSRTLAFFREHPDCQALSGNCRTIDEKGAVLRDPWRDRRHAVIRRLGAGPLWKAFGFIGATAAYRAGMLRAFGPLDPRCGSEDTPGVVRGQLAGGSAVLPEVLVGWRRHSASLSFSSEGRGAMRAKFRKARGAYRDAQQIRRDILRAIAASMRDAAEVQGALREAAVMYHQNRIKYHLLHPRRRAKVVLGMIVRLLAEPQIPWPTRLLLAAKRLGGLLRPRPVSA